MPNIILREADAVVRANEFPHDTLELIFSVTTQDIDLWMTDFINDELQTTYDNIFIPISFDGNDYEFLGIRLAYHLRLTSGGNQLSNIYLYGPQTYEEIKKLCPIAAILGCKGVKMIDYTFEDISQHLNGHPELTSISESSSDLSKLEMKIPDNFYDSHSIANFWGLYRLSEVAGVNTDQLSSLSIYGNHLNSLYIKWLLFISIGKNIRNSEVKKIEKRYAESLAKPKVLGNIDLSRTVQKVNFKTLIIDDEASKGWTELLENILSLSIEAINNISDAKAALDSTVYDFIFLDLRFGEEDHQNTDLNNYGGYKLIQHIRSNFDNKNFSTPVIIITATNKAWNITALLENGADAFYIKERPDYSNDPQFSQRNYQNLLKSIGDFKVLCQKRREVWDLIAEIKKNARTIITVQNIRDRIEEKLKIGYGVLFGYVSEYQKKTLLYNAELLAYIVFWSILEEVSHYFYDRKQNIADVTWQLRNGEKLQYVDGKGKLISVFQTVADEHFKFDIRERSDRDHEVRLSSQISGILRYHLGWNHNQIYMDFLGKLNNYRNKVDFIHSDTNQILTSKLSSNQDSVEAYGKCLSMLKLIRDILK